MSKEFKKLPESAKRRSKLILGHISFGLHEFLPQPFTYITFLRDPVERIISLFYFIRRVPGHPYYSSIVSSNMSLEEFVGSGISKEVDNVQTRLLTDSRTFRTIRYSIGKGKLKLNRDELRELDKIERVCNEEFNVFAKHSNVFTIIGETEENLFKSIHALACADIVIKSSASCFPNHVQEKFSKPNHSSILIEPWKWNEQTVESMEQLVQEKLLCPSISQD